MSVVQSSPPARSEPAWEIARLFPDQGDWEEVDYLALTDNARYLVELVHGRVEVLTMPTLAHQRIVNYIRNLLEAFVLARELGEVLSSPLRVRLGKKHFREPDIVFVRTKNVNPDNDRYYERADLVMEVVSDDPGDRERDLTIKRAAYARAGFPEYWIIDPEATRILVLKLVGKRYVEHAKGTAGDCVGSALLRGFELGVDEVFAAAKFRARR
jgi:Uma2 family endonuclease